MAKRGYPLFQLFSITVHKEQKFVFQYGEVDDDGNVKSLSPDVSEDLMAEESIKLYGTITTLDGDRAKRFVYNRPREMPEYIYTNDLMPLSILKDSSICTSTYGLEMRFDLKDADGDLEISRGWLTYDEALDPLCYFGKRLSCVIPGEHGSAAVYYMLLPYAIQAYVKVQLLVDRVNIDAAGSCYVVSGSLFARYSGHEYEYSSESQKKYYQIVLFRKKPQEGVLVSADGNSITLPLSSPLLAVPMDASLIVEADLVVKFGETEIATVRKTTELPQEPQQEIDKGLFASSSTIADNNAQLNVTVSWSNWGT